MYIKTRMLIKQWQIHLKFKKSHIEKFTTNLIKFL
jgi:hypothetical protein